MKMLGLRAAMARCAAPAGMLALILLAFGINRFSDVDLSVSRAFFDPLTHRFPWREQWFAVGVLHEGARFMSIAGVLVLLAVLLAGFVRPASVRWRGLREPAFFTLLTALAAAWLVAVLKHQSQHSCPWDLSLFGGRFDHFRLLGALPARPGPGQCLPSGHASTGFMWIGALYAAARWPQVPGAQGRGWRIGWLVFALATSLVQVVRGAHFLSHVLIAAAVCWAIAWALDRAWWRVRALSALPVPVPVAGAQRPAPTSF